MSRTRIPPSTPRRPCSEPGTARGRVVLVHGRVGAQLPLPARDPPPVLPGGRAGQRCRDPPGRRSGRACSGDRGRSVSGPGRIQLSPAGRSDRAPRRGSGSTPHRRPRPSRSRSQASRVTVTAVPEVEWRFGDGVAARGTGMAYRPGPTPAEASTHAYDTRCLPGRPRPEPLRARELWRARLCGRSDRDLAGQLHGERFDRGLGKPGAADDHRVGDVSRE